ncbi:reverse transcriptase domain-containing protein [Tanacetum coccineum]
MKEVHYHSWLSNPVKVKKHDNSWRMCVDFKDLNKACPKDGYQLPEIDWKVESLCGYPFKCFLDAYKGYHQIKMAKEDEEKTAFITNQGILCYSKMPFALKKCTKKNDFQWTAEAEATFKQMKKLIAELPTLTAPMEKEELIVYLAAAREVTLFTDGSSSIDGSGAGLILTNPEGTKFAYVLRFRFVATNNEVEYEALIAGLRIAEQMGIKNLQANMDSRLVANQVNGSYIEKESGMIQYLEKVKTLASSFKSFAHLTKQVLVEELKEKSINEAELLAIVEEEGDTWMTPIYEYLTEETLPTEKEKARVVRRKLRRYAVINGYARRNKICGSKSHTDRILLPTMHADARKMIRECQDCQRFASVKHPQANDVVERANRSLGEGIKARLDERSKDWIEEIPYVLWAHRTMIKSSNGDTLFLLTYGTEAVILAEIGMPTLRTAKIDMAQNDEALEINLDLLEERKEQGAIREARSKAKMEKYYNSKVRNTSFKLGDLVYWNNDASHAKDSGKLGPKWEGPYEVMEALGKGAYKLRDRNGELLPRTWNWRRKKELQHAVPHHKLTLAQEEWS